jgi:ABC-type lipoprotein export system ATPase subunit
MVTHDRDLARRVSRTVWIADGRIVTGERGAEPARKEVRDA